MYTPENRRRISSNPIATFIKLRYYRLFAWLYGKCGRAADTVMVNSSWTEEHVNKIWRTSSAVHKVFPPCEVSHLGKVGRLFYIILSIFDWDLLHCSNVGPDNLFVEVVKVWTYEDLVVKTEAWVRADESVRIVDDFLWTVWLTTENILKSSYFNELITHARGTW